MPLALSGPLLRWSSDPQVPTWTPRELDAIATGGWRWHRIASCPSQQARAMDFGAPNQLHELANAAITHDWSN